MLTTPEIVHLAVAVAWWSFAWSFLWSAAVFWAGYKLGNRKRGG